MSYDNPENVGNYGQWKYGKVLYNGGPSSWSVAEGLYDGESRLGIRWNGDDHRPDYPSVPKMGEQPLWFIVPRELEASVRIALDVMRP